MVAVGVGAIGPLEMVKHATPPRGRSTSGILLKTKEMPERQRQQRHLQPVGTSIGPGRLQDNSLSSRPPLLPVEMPRAPSFFTPPCVVVLPDFISRLHFSTGISGQLLTMQGIDHGEERKRKR